MELEQVIVDIANTLKGIDGAGSRFKEFQPGVGPYGEPQLVKLLAGDMARLPQYKHGVVTKRTPDLMICGHWAIEAKIVRPFGDNNRVAENWSVNLLHPYNGNTSLLGDCLKLRALECTERKAALAIGYEHVPPQISLEPLFAAFELIATGVMKIKLGSRVMERREELIHPVHQQLVVVGWEISSG